MSTRLNARFAFLLAGVAACGNVAGPHNGQDFAALNGTITSTTTTSSQSVRVAIIWSTQGSGTENTPNVSQDVAVQGSFPAAFTIPLDALPPAAAIQPIVEGNGDIDESSQVAVGAIVVYKDNNGNGKLDLVSLNEPGVDEILGTLPSEFLLYIEGTPPPSTVFGSGNVTLTPGFNLISEPTYVPNPMASCEPGCEETPVGEYAAVPLSAPIAIALDGNPQLANYLCQNSSVLDVSDSFQPSLPPTGATVTCSTDRTAYEWTLCAPLSAPCADEECEQGFGTRTAGEAAPANWPCP